MQTGQYITERLMPLIIGEICKARGIALRSFSNDWLFELEKDKRRAHILGYRFSLNNSAAGMIAQDKVASFQLMEAHGVAAIPHYLIRQEAGEAQWQHNWQRGMVIKPLSGTGGQCVQLCRTLQAAQEAVSNSSIRAWAISPFHDIAREIRLIILDGNVLLSYEKQPSLTNDLKLFNLGQDAISVNCTTSPQLIDLAVRAQHALGLRLCAIDIVETTPEEYAILEVNDGIMMEHYARHSTENRAKACQVYEAIVDALYK